MQHQMPSTFPCPSVRPPWALVAGVLLLATTAFAGEATAPRWAQLQPLPPPAAAAPRPPREDACQPDGFIPGETPYERVDTHGTPATLYELRTGERMNINGWQKQDESLRKLPAPFSLTYYQFGCASERSYVLDVSRAGKRHALYQHVFDFAVHPTLPLLFLVQTEHNANRPRGFVGLVDLATKRKTPLPTLACTASPDARFSPPYLITHGEAPQRKGATDVCVWNVNGTLRTYVTAELDWTAGAGNILLDRVGVLAHEPDTLYALHHDRFRTPTRCQIQLQSLSHAGAFKQVDLGVVESRKDCIGKESALSTMSLTTSGKQTGKPPP